MVFLGKQNIEGKGQQRMWRRNIFRLACLLKNKPSPHPNRAHLKNSNYHLTGHQTQKEPTELLQCCKIIWFIVHFFMLALVLP